LHPLLADRRRLGLYLLALGLAGAMLVVVVSSVLGRGWMDAMVLAVPVAIAGFPLSLSAWYLCRALPLARTPVVSVLGAAAGSGAASGALWAGAALLWWTAIDSAPPPAGLAPLFAAFGASEYLISVAVHYLVQAFDESTAAARRVLESSVAQRDAELRALRAQVDPHFLFNSLNSIAGLTMADAPRAREMCQRLADFLRESLAVGAAPRISLAREVALAEQYLRVEQVRFGRRLEVQLDVAAEGADVPVPPLILQPLVENAVRHGVATLLDGGTVAIAARRAGDRLMIDVRNPRDPDGTRPGTGRGLDLVRRRLSAAFGDRAAMAVEAASGAYRVSLTLPAGEDRR